MNRRLLLTALACCASAHLWAQGDAAPRHKLSAGELHKALAQHFPRRFDLAGLLQLQVDALGVLLLPSRNKLGATLRAQARGAALQALPPGEMDVVFSLRWEASDQSLRAHEPQVLALRWPGLPPDIALALTDVLPVLARQALGEVVVYRFNARELELTQTLGVEPRKLTVQDDGLLVEFGPQRAR